MQLDPSLISLQTQPTSCTCVQTCIAMALNEDVSKVIELIGKNSMNQKELIVSLERFKIRHNQFVFGDIVSEGWHFAAVPSLNISGGLHEILLHWNYETGMTILDPSPLKKYNSDGSNLKSWADLTYFIPGGKLI